MVPSPQHSAARSLRTGVFTSRAMWLAAASITAGAGTILAGVGLMATSGYLISRAAQQPPVLDLMLVFVTVRFFGIARPALRYLERLASHELTFRLLLAIRRWFVSALLPLSHGQLMSFRSGDLLSRLAADVDTLQEAYLRVGAPAIVAAIVSTAVVTTLMFIDRTLALVVFALLVFNGVVWSWIAHRQARGTSAERNEQRRALSADLVMLLQGMQDVLAFGHEEVAVARLAERQRHIDVAEANDGRRLALHAAVGTAVAALAFWCVLAITLPAAQAGDLSPLWIAALALAIAAAFESVEGLPAAWQFAGRTRDSAQRVLDIVRTTPAIVDKPDAAPRSGQHASDIRFDRVSFGFGSTVVLRDVSIHINAGEHVAIVGPTGAGKSTILTLLMRGWDPSDGCITIDGVDVRDLRLDDLRAHVAVLPQQVHVFNDSLRENVRLARPAASDREVTDALVRAHLGSFHDGLPQGLDTLLGEHGARMSAGERQRLGFARLLLTDAPVVLADEPTANLDAEHERALLADLRSWARGRTLLVVSHRTAALPHMDRVLLVDGGTVAEASLDDLVATPAINRRSEAQEDFC